MQNDLYALERMHADWILQARMLRRKFDVFEWKYHALYRSVRNDLEIDTNRWKILQEAQE